MWKDFKAFVNRGNFIDLAVAFIVAAALGKVISSLVNDIVMPPIGYLLGGVDFGSMYINLSNTSYASYSDALKAGAPVIGWGAFLNTLIEFLIVMLVIFLIVRYYDRLRNLRTKEVETTTKDCPYCVSTIPVNATRCPNCTSALTGTTVDGKVAATTVSPS